MTHQLPRFSRFASTSTSLISSDIMVVGGGSVGSAFVSAIGSLGVLNQVSCRLVARKPSRLSLEQPRLAEMRGRSMAISPASRDFLDNIGVWSRIDRRFYHPVQKMAVWDSYGGHLEFGERKELLCYIIDERVLAHFLEERAREFLPADHIHEQSVIDVNAHDDPENVVIACADGRHVDCRLLVACDGACSAVKQRLDLPSRRLDYEMTAHVATVTATDPIEHVAFQKFTSDSIIGLLPLGEGNFTVIWSANNDLSRELEKMPDKDFLNALNRSLAYQESGFRDEIPEFVSSAVSAAIPGYISGSTARAQAVQFGSIVPDARITFPLELDNVCQYILGRVVLAGDAAHRVHPLAGQGLNLGFGDVELLADLLSTHLEGHSINDTPTYLKQYNLKRKLKAEPMVRLTSELVQLYCKGSAFTPLASIGMSALNVSSILKKLLVGVAKN